jgi:hypothetical protein
MSGVICVKCGLWMKVETNGVTVEQMSGARPISLTSADLLKCPKCGAEAVLTAEKPLAESYQEKEYAFWRKKAIKIIKVTN